MDVDAHDGRDERGIASRTSLDRLLVVSEVIVRDLADLKAQVINTNALTAAALSGLQERQARVEERYRTVQTELAALTKLLRDGNGQRSLLDRVAINETQIRSLLEAVDRLEEATDRVAISETQIKGLLEHVSHLEEVTDRVANSKLLTRSQLIAGGVGIVVTVLLSAVAVAVSLLNPR